MSTARWDGASSLRCDCGELEVGSELNALPERSRKVRVDDLGAHLRQDHLGSLELLWRCGQCEFEAGDEAELLSHAFRRRHAPDSAAAVLPRSQRLFSLAARVYAANPEPRDPPSRDLDDAAEPAQSDSPRLNPAGDLLGLDEDSSPSMVAPPRLFIPSLGGEADNPFRNFPFLLSSASLTPPGSGGGEEKKLLFPPGGLDFAALLKQGGLSQELAKEPEGPGNCEEATEQDPQTSQLSLMRIANQIRKRRRFEQMRRHQPWMNADDTRSRSSCAKCGGRFLIHDRKGRLNTSVLSNHAALHFPVPPYRCGNCSYQSARKANVENHIMRIHSHAPGAVLTAQCNYSEAELRRQLETTMKLCFPQFTSQDKMELPPLAESDA